MSNNKMNHDELADKIRSMTSQEKENLFNEYYEYHDGVKAALKKYEITLQKIVEKGKIEAIEKKINSA